MRQWLPGGTRNELPPAMSSRWALKAANLIKIDPQLKKLGIHLKIYERAFIILLTINTDLLILQRRRIYLFAFLFIWIRNYRTILNETNFT